MSLLLVLAAAVALVIGLLQSGLAIIYVSIGCSVVAGILLAVAVVRGRPEKVISGPMPQPAPQPASQSWQSQPAREPAASEREPVMAGVGASSSSPDSTQQLDQAAIELAVRGDDGDLAIADYDRLRATEVLPLLANLDADELAQIRVHEVSGRNRFMVLSRIDRELEGRGAADQASDEPASPEWDADDEWEGSADAATGEDEDDDAGDESQERPPPRRASGSRSASILDNYEQLKVLEILPRLAELNSDQLAQVRRREQSGQRRAMIINRVDRLIVDARPAASAPARRGPAKRATAKKAAPAKVAARATASKAPVKKAVAKKAPARKAVAKTAVAKKAPSKRAAVRRSTPTEKRAAAVKKTSRAAKKR